jgi:manganese-dependent inorganic pyrophosphatase
MHYIIGHIKPDLDSAVAALSLQFLFQKQACFQRQNAKAVLAGKPNFETRAMFTKFKQNMPKVLKENQVKNNDEFVLVDHNEELQRLPGIKTEQITDIFDHHKVFLNTGKPIFITIKPWGSSATIIAWLMDQHKITPDKNLAGLIIAAILSDTNGLKSSTAADQDKNMLKNLNKLAKIDIKKLTFEIFKAKSSLKGLNTLEILKKDYKIYEFGSKKVMVNQIETVEQKEILKEKDSYLSKFTDLKKQMKVDLYFLMLTDVLNINTKLLVLNNEEKIVKKAFLKAKKVSKNVWDIGSVISRKKEVAPAIEKAVS